MVVLPGVDDAVPDVGRGDTRSIAVATMRKRSGMLGANTLSTVAGRWVCISITFQLPFRTQCGGF